MTGIKIAVVGTRGFPNVQGGVEKHCEELYPRLASLGYDVTVFTRSPYIPEEKRTSDWKGVKFIHLWCPRGKYSEAITHTFVGILKARALAPDILHIHSIGPSLFAPLARFFGLKVVMTHHGPDYERAKWGPVAKTVLKMGEKTGVLYSDRVIAISLAIREMIRSRHGRETTFIPNGVNRSEFTPPGEALHAWGLQTEKYIFTACRFVPEKGVHDLVEAYRSIESPPFQLVVAGDADHESGYSRKLKMAASETEGVVLTGVVSGRTLAELYSNAGLFVLPSSFEGLPIALLEALSYGLPVLVSDILQQQEIRLGKSRYFKSGDIRDLAKSMMNAFLNGISDSEQKQNIALVEANNSWDDIAMKTDEIYREVL